MCHGMTAVLLVLLVGAEPSPKAAEGIPYLPDSCLRLRMQPLLLLSRPDVRADVGLDEKLARMADVAINEQRERADASHSMPEADARERRRDIDQAAELWLKTNLTLAQLKRLSEVDLQWEGPSALITRPKVAEHLKLTRSQCDALRHAVMVRNSKRAPGTFDAAVEEGLTHETSRILSPLQCEIWMAMMGRRFVPQLAGATNHPRK